MTEEKLFDLIKSHFNIEHLKQVTFDFTNQSIELVVAPPVTINHIKFDAVLVNKENNFTWKDTP